MALPPKSDIRPSIPLRGLALCAGVGGLEIGIGLAEPGYKTVCYVERDSFAASVLVARMEDEVLCDAPVWDDLVTFDGRPWRGAVDILTAGYPCQPFSAAGRKLSDQDPRHLWPHVARIINDCRPPVVFLENVAGHVDRGFREVAGELQGMGYSVQAGLFSAAEVGAPHWRVRLFVLAYANSAFYRQPDGVEGLRQGGAMAAGRGPEREPGSYLSGGRELDGFSSSGDSAGLAAGDEAELPIFAPRPCDYPAWERVLSRRVDLEPSLHGLADGLAHRVDRCQSAGNGVSPLAAALAWSTLNARFREHLGHH